MVFGIGEGNIDIVVDKRNFAYGETIKGIIILDLKKAKAARGLRICVKQIETSYRKDKRSGRPKQQLKILYDFKLDLDGEKEYPAGRKEYPFELPLPQRQPEIKMPEGVAGAVINAAVFLGSAGKTVKWQLDASLDAPGFDINKKVDISVM